MDDRRFQTSVAVVLIISLFTIGRVLTETNPIYDLLEPAVTKLDQLSQSLHFGASAGVMDADQIAQQEIADLQQENQQLRDQLELNDKQTNLLSAEVTRRELFEFNKRVWLDRGKSDGISKGDVVLANGSVFGRVTQVFDDTASITVISDPSTRITVVTPDDLHGILKVQNGSLIVDLLPSKDLEGVVISSDGLDGRIPSGIRIGTLRDQHGSNSDIYGKYSIDLPYNPVDVEFVQVVIAKDVQ